MNSKKTILLLLIAVILLSSCGPLYYGYLPGTDYKIMKPLKSYDFKNQTINPNILDFRENVENISCTKTILDRNTELEGNTGLKLFKEAITRSLTDSKFTIDNNSQNTYNIKLNAISFQILGIGYIEPHGFIQFQVEHNGITKTYCSDMTDTDDDSPIAWYSVQTRKSATRAIVSGSLRRAVESFIKDLENGQFN